MADRRVKDEAKRASSLKREADSPDKSYVFEFLDSLDLTNPIDSLHETEKHRTHGLLHVIEKLTNLGVSALSCFSRHNLHLEYSVFKLCFQNLGAIGQSKSYV